ncbi:MAG: rod shape-determining protein [Candidatus Binataceae bacterium]
MQILRAISRVVSDDLAIDLGTANTLIYRRDAGIICDEPSMIAVRRDGRGGRRVLAIGAEAKKMLGRTPDSISVTRPLKDGVIADFEGAGEMLQHFIRKVKKRNLVRPRLVICAPSGITAVERRAVEESALCVGARTVHVIAEPMAAAFGANLPVTEPVGSMIVDIGGGTAEIAVISVSSLVCAHSLRLAGDKMDEAIIEHIRGLHSLQIGEKTAELIKVLIGSAMPDSEGQALEIRGRDVASGRPRTVEITDEEIRQALNRTTHQLVESVRGVLETTPPELISDIAEHGIMLAGGGALLRNLDRLLTSETGLPVKVAPDPLRAVAIGAGKLLDQPAMLERIASK